MNPEYWRFIKDYLGKKANVYPEPSGLTIFVTRQTAEPEALKLEQIIEGFDSIIIERESSLADVASQLLNSFKQKHSVLINFKSCPTRELLSVLKTLALSNVLDFFKTDSSRVVYSLSREHQVSIIANAEQLRFLAKSSIMSYVDSVIDLEQELTWH